MAKHDLNPKRIFSASGCLTEDALMLYTQHHLSAAQQLEIEEHLSHCDLCSDSLEGYTLWMEKHALKQPLKAGYETLKVSPAAFFSRTALIRKRIKQRVNFHKQVVAVKNQRKIQKPYTWLATAATVILFLAVFYIVRVQNIFDNQKLAETIQNKETTIPIHSNQLDSSSANMVEIAQNQSRQGLKRILPAKAIDEKTTEKDNLQIINNSEIVLHTEVTETKREETLAAPVTISADEQDISAMESKVKPAAAQSSKRIDAEEDRVVYVEGVTTRAKSTQMGKSDVVFEVVEQQPQFPGGEQKMKEFLSTNLKYPALAKENGVSGTVVVTFVVQKNGKIVDIKILKGIGAGCDEEAVSAVQKMPNWTPGKLKGKKVNVSLNLPIEFRLK